jgi:hypothetical protein
MCELNKEIENLKNVIAEPKEKIENLTHKPEIVQGNLLFLLRLNPIGADHELT